jgi:hypothetical protein
MAVIFVGQTYDKATSPVLLISKTSPLFYAMLQYVSQKISVPSQVLPCQLYIVVL